MKNILKRSINYLGYNLSRYKKEKDPKFIYNRMLNKFNIKTIFDIGANEGNYGLYLRDIGFKGNIISFEPLSSAYIKLIKTSKKDINWQVAPRMAIGNEDGVTNINISENSESSSILNILDSHVTADNNSMFIGREEVTIHKFDTIFHELNTNQLNYFLKIDTQGFEDRVLDGASEILKNIIGIQVELSFVQLYSGQILYNEMVDKLNKLGYNLWAYYPVFINSETGKLLQVDAIFFRNL